MQSESQLVTVLVNNNTIRQIHIETPTPAASIMKAYYVFCLPHNINVLLVWAFNNTEKRRLVYN